MSKLNGQVYTPLALAQQVVDGLRWPDGQPGAFLDAACGDGVFLQAAVERLVALGRGEEADQVMGTDVDADAVLAATERVERVCREHGLTARPQIVHRDGLDLDHPVAAFIGNPPYLESKRMPDALKKRIKADFPLSGRGGFDLYSAFIELGMRHVVPGGELALIVPNRICVAKANDALRRALVDAGRVHVLDLSEQDVFRNAAVYPVVLSWVAGGPNELCVMHPDGRVKARMARAALSRLGDRFPLPPPAVMPLLTRLLHDPVAYPPLADQVQIRWTVSFHRAGLRDQYVFAEAPDTSTARRFVGGARYSGNREVQPFHIQWAGAWIDYDEPRARADRNALPPAALFTAPKVAIPQNARRPRAALDRSGAVLKDTFLAGVPAHNNPDVLPWLVLVINSALFHHLYEALFGGTRKGGKFLHLLRGYLELMPLPTPPDEANAVHEALCLDPTDEALIAQAEQLVRRAYGVTDDEHRALEELELPGF
ncbi:MAG: N-6 DNA methylase [Myxococcota bacterium]